MICYVSVSAYNTDDIVNISYIWTDTLASIYNVPDWQDLVITSIDTDSILHIQLYDWVNPIAWGIYSTPRDIELIVHDELFAITSWTWDVYDIHWYLVDEGVDIHGTGINKPVFTTETIEEIYKYEWVIMIFITLITFFLRITWRKRKGKIIFWKN